MGVSEKASHENRSSRDGAKKNLVFAKTDLAGRVVCLETSETDERLWVALHADRGPFLLGAWYRPPAPGDTSGVDTLKEELLRLEGEHLGTVLVGDLNVHHQRWLKYSNAVTPEGRDLYNFCNEYGFCEFVKKPTPQ